MNSKINITPTERLKNNSDRIYICHIIAVLFLTFGSIIWRTFFINVESYFENKPIALALQSVTLQKVHWLLLSLSGNIFYELILEILFTRDKSLVSFVNGDKAIIKLERFFLFLITFIPSFLYSIDSNNQTMPLLYVNMNMSLNSIGFMILIFRLLKEEKDRYIIHKFSVRVILIYLLSISFNIGQIIYIYNCANSSSKSAETIRAFIEYSSCFLFLYILYIYIKEFRENFDLLSKNRVAIILYGLIIGFFMIVNILINFIFGSFSFETKVANNLIAMVVCQFFFTLPAVSLPRFLSIYKLRETCKLLYSNQRDFARYVSHEIRTPLSIVIGELDELKTLISIVNYENLCKLMPKVNEILFSIDHEVSTAVKMLDQILNYESIDDAGSVFLISNFVKLQNIMSAKFNLSLAIYAQSKGVNLIVIDNSCDLNDIEEYVMNVDVSYHILINYF